ncbi:peptide ABC transporter substrate-binding protein [Thermomicrobium sp. CFH 73360]|uniref:peptide ABC transporter substrate-binding protein n=1 Tax=Thermomicrobium sp. CFH 73360 TaxID=2951987 RepID=UPI0020774C34|nr:peptide ABC transporter substrate-binding protein [Thermomicrobium sp. CFH 73360]MCM8745738.1 peptide ABC transporter substrate-binding protein [Thermomicrobium sp. CFH 73360]
MNEFERLQAEIGAGQVTRREVLRRAAALGLTAPAIASLLAACGGAQQATPTAAPAAQTPAAAATPTQAGVTPAAQATPSPAAQRGGGGTLRLLWWQAPTILNPHLAQGTKDFDASNVVFEALAYFDAEDKLVPRLAEEIPSVEKGTLDPEGRWVIWKLRKNVKWHDGEPFTAKDVKFTWEYITDEKTTATTIGSYRAIESVEIVDDYTVKVNFKQPNPAWFEAFVGDFGLILPEHKLREFKGEKARNAEFNLKPIGTGPYKVVEFKPGDVVVYEINQDYWQDGKPYFDRVELKGGGDATSAARAVLQTGEVDWAWNLQVEAQVLLQLEKAGQGKLVIGPGAFAERIMVNFADPNTEKDGARAEPDVPHPFLTNKNIRQAIALAIRRDVIAEQLYGPAGQVTANNLNAPARFKHPDLKWEFNLEKAAQLLDEAGAKDSNGDSVREYNGKPLQILYQTSINSIRQRTQEIVKAELEKIGFKVELKSIDASVFFSSDPGNPDTYGHFYADIEMYTNGPSNPFPLNWARRYHSREVARKANNWAGINITRYQNPEMDKILDQLATEMDPDKQTELFRQINWISVTDIVEIPLVHRNEVSAAAKNLTGYQPSTWASDLWNIADWRRQ